jgi:hypothetical protein
LTDQAASRRQFVILSGEEPTEGGGLAPIGARGEVCRRLADCNTGPECEDADDVLFGPGLRIELTPHQDPITQMLVTLTEEEIGWQVLTRLIREFHWKLLDPDSGRELSPQQECE